MIVTSKAPGFTEVEIIANTREEFIDNAFKECAFYWDGDVTTDTLVKAWHNLITKEWTFIDGIVFEVKA